MDGLNMGKIILLVGLFIFAAFLSASETSLLKVNIFAVRRMVEDKVTRAKVLMNLLEHQSRFLATILLLTLAVQLGASAVATVIALESLPFGAGIATGIMTILIFIYSEMIPKTFAAQHAERVALIVARPISWLTRIFYPIVYIFIQIANLFIKLLGGSGMSQGPFVTEDEIKTIVTVGEEEGVIESEEKEMIHSIFEFTDTVVREVMVPRTDMVALDDDDSLKDLLTTVMQSGHSRVPIYRESIDHIEGVAYAKDLLPYINRGELEIKLSKIMRPAYIVPETMSVSVLLGELKRRKVHMAIIVDEYGGTAGLATIEDLLEEIVGEIFDEYDLEQVIVENIDEDTVRVDAMTGIAEIEELLGIEFPECDCDTIGGLIFSLFNKIPEPGESIEWGNLRFIVERVDDNRVKKVVIKKLNRGEPLDAD